MRGRTDAATNNGSDTLLGQRAHTPFGITTDARKGPTTLPHHPRPYYDGRVGNSADIVGTGGWGWGGPLRASFLLSHVPGWKLFLEIQTSMPSCGRLSSLHMPGEVIHQVVDNESGIIIRAPAPIHALTSEDAPGGFGEYAGEEGRRQWVGESVVPGNSKAAV